MHKPRLRRLFAADGRTVIIALDHAAFFGPLPGLDQPGQLLAAAARAGADAVLTTYGVANRFSDRLGHLGLILRADGGSTRAASTSGGLHRLFGAEDALRLGADAVACMGMIGFPDETASLRILAGLVQECLPWGLPVMAEMLVQKRGDNHVAPDDIAFAARVGAELGADLIKTSYIGPASAFQAALQQCYRPVVVLGGDKAADGRTLLASVAESLQAGAVGVAIGRNVWQHANPEGMMRALVALVHGGATVDQALKETT